MNQLPVKFTWSDQIALPQPRDDWRYVFLEFAIDPLVDVYEIQLVAGTRDEPSLTPKERAFVMEEILPMMEDEWSDYMDEHGDDSDPADWVAEAGLTGEPDTE